MREALRSTFLENAGIENNSLISLPMDASKRCYFRLPKMLLMDAPPPHESTRNFQTMAHIIREAGLSAPQVYEADHDHGFLLIEDFGELTYRKAFQEGYSESLLYEEVIQSLIHLHKNALENKGNLPLYDLDLFLKEAEIFLEWYDLNISPQAAEDFKGLWRQAYALQPPIPHSIVLRDVLVDNLMWLSDRENFKRCGFLDFQDGVWGPITYDLVSLLEDARRDIAPEFGKAMIKIYFRAFPHLEPEAFWASYNLWGAQRCTKILGIFSRLAKRDGKAHYLTHLPRVKMILERDLCHPSLQALHQWYQGVKLW